MEKILTISVAAYNVEKYVEETINSIIESKYRDEIELIITNDGSKDNTANIIKRYKDLYPNIINFIDQENGGAGSTVNNGIKNATGKYFKMVDGDDWVLTENLDLLIEYLKKIDVDVVLTNFKFFYELDKTFGKGNSYKLENRKIYNFEEVCHDLDIATSTVTYKTSILQENNIEVSKRYYSDYQFQVYPIPFISTISYIDIDVYIYRIGREGQSVSIKGYQSHIDDHQRVMFQLLHYYEENKKNCSTNIQKYMLRKLSSFINVDISVLLSYKTNKTNREKIIATINRIKEISNEVYEYAKKQKIIKILVNSNYFMYGIMSLLKRLKSGK